MEDFCKICGTKLEEGANFCIECGAPSVTGAAEPNIPFRNPGAQSSYYTPGAYRSVPAAPAVPKPQGYTLSILAVVFGALGGLGLIFGIIGLGVNESHDSGVETRSIIGIGLSVVWAILIFSIQFAELYYR